ncbi:MAG: hypothetical protein ACRDJM_03650, partial [Actinomycetota bacterium]
MRAWTALFVTGLLALAPGPSPASGPGCAWPAELEPTLVNVLYPDQSARYWVTAIPAAPDTSLVLRGAFPHARYMSFTTYTATAQSIDGIHDARIVPDAGGTNPFFPGADRTAAARGYTVRVVIGNRPAVPQQNTLYTGNEDGSKSARFFLLAYRVFRPDAGRGDAGGVPLPTITVRQPGLGDVALPDCETPAIPPNDVNATIANTDPVAPALVGYPGLDPPVWHKFYNFAEAGSRSTDNEITGTSLSDEMAPGAMERFPKGGFADNPDNNYIYTFVNRGYRPLVLLRGRLPTTPRTVNGEPVMGSGQLRYWSLCTNHALTQRFYACLTDDQLVTDADGDYRIVISAQQDRPADATPECGNNWLPMGPTNDTVLIMRNMLPDPAFEYSIQQAGYGTE